MRILVRKLSALLLAAALLLCNPGISLAAETAKNIYAQDYISRNTTSLRRLGTGSISAVQGYDNEAGINGEETPEGIMNQREQGEENRNQESEEAPPSGKSETDGSDSMEDPSSQAAEASSGKEKDEETEASSEREKAEETEVSSGKEKDEGAEASSGAEQEEGTEASPGKEQGTEEEVHAAEDDGSVSRTGTEDERESGISTEERQEEHGEKESSRKSEKLPEKKEKGSEEASSSERLREEKKKEKRNTTEDAGENHETGTEQPAAASTAETTTEALIPPQDQKKLKAAAKSGNHQVTMPDRTSHYFLLQKNSEHVSSVSDSNVKVVPSEKEAARYIFNEYPNGTAYNFSPTMTAETKVRVGGGSGGTVSLNQVEEGDYDEYGELIRNIKIGAIASKVFNLNKCTSDPYAIYTNVGSWYDSETRKSYKVDMKMTVTGALYPGEETRRELFSDKMTAPYVGFTNNNIGMITSRTDDVDVTVDFFYHGTEDKIEGIKGIIQFFDIDAQQGVDLGSGFRKVILFDTGSSLLQYSSGLISGSKGYISSRTMKNLEMNDKNTTVLGLFSGNGVKFRFTLSKCDQLDTGGKAKYAVQGGFRVPAADSLEEAICYYYANSTGFMGIRTDVKIIAPPDEPAKNIYQGEIDKNQSQISDRVVFLENRNDPLVFVVSSGVNMTPDSGSARYKVYEISDRVDPLFKVNSVKIYAASAGGTGSVSPEDAASLFKMNIREEKGKGTVISASAEAAALKSDAFYSRVYYLHIGVLVKSDEELEEEGISLEDYYQKDNRLGSSFEGEDFGGTYAVDNCGKLKVADQFDIMTEKESLPCVTGLTVKLAVKKLDRESGQAVKGVKFGLFPGKNIQDYKEEDAICLAETDAQGIALFQSDGQNRFYREKYGDGPYCIKEISVPESMKNVWDIDRGWVYTITSLKELRPGDQSLLEVDRTRTVTNQNRELPGNSVRVYKTSRDTGEFLKDAVFSLSEWSESRQEYVAAADLEESRDDMGRLVYTNKDRVLCTMDNLGRFKIMEIKAPPGCVLTGREWIFTADGGSEDGSHALNYEESSSKRKQEGYVNCRNSLQKAVLHILKQDDEGKYVPGVVFHVKAAEDIYAPWNLDETGKPLPGADKLVAKGTLVDRIVTGKDGSGRTSEGKELYVGSYDIEEVSGAANHVKGQEIYHVTLSYGTDQTEKYLTYHLLANNNVSRPSFAVSKLADRTRNPEGKPVKYDEKTGRYTEKKIAGQYAAGDSVDYTVRITNTGNTSLYHLEVTDDMDKKNKEYGYSLSRFINMETAAFVIPDSGLIRTEKGKKARVYYFEKSRLKVMVSQLDSGDSITLHVNGKILNNARDGYQLENEVYVSAKYNAKEDGEEQHLEEVPVEHLLDAEGSSLVKDQDYLNVPGSPGTAVLKRADKTGGITISNGEMTGGRKIPGIYKAGEKVRYHIIVKNTGTVRLKNIHVRDVMSQRLAAVIDLRHASFVLGDQDEQEKELITFSGKTVKAKLLKPDEVLLCGGEEGESGENRLYSGDYVELVYEAVILKDVANLYDLSNEVLVNCMYFDGNGDQPLEEKKDTDKIEIPGEPAVKTAKLADRTRGAVLENGRYRAGSKICGVYENGDTVTYKITVTNTGTANLYRLRLTDELSEELQRALDVETVSFEDGTYQTSEGRKIRTSLIDRQTLLMDFLAAGDSVNVYLHGKVQKEQGNLFNLKNTVSLEAAVITGNENEIRESEKTDAEDQKNYTLTYHSNWTRKEEEKDGETPCSGKTVIHINGCSFDRPDYLFAGWNTRPDGSGDSYSPDALYVMPAANVHLYAQWSGKPVDSRKEKACRLIYDSNNIRDQKEYDEENPGIPGQIMTVNDNSFLFPGRSFVGWNTRRDGSGKNFSPSDQIKLENHDLYLYAQWIKNSSCSLTYDSNNGSGVTRRDSETPCARGTEVIIDGNDFSCRKEGIACEFAGWNSRQDGSGDTYMPGETKEVNTDVVLYAQWTESPAEEEEESGNRLYYHANNGTVDYAVDAQTPAAEGNKIDIDKNSFRSGVSVFNGWNTKSDGSGKTYKEESTFSMPDHDVHLYAQWKDNSARLFYHSNVEGEKESLVAEDAQTPAAVKTKVKIDGIMFENTGYHFTGWNEKADGSGRAFGPGDEIVLKEDVHLYARWTVSKEKYRLVYHSAYPDQAKQDRRERAAKNYSETDGETPCFAYTCVDINENHFPVPEGYRFTGWNGKADGSGVSCQPGDHYTMPGSDVHLYAQWISTGSGQESSPDDDKPDPEDLTGDQIQETDPGTESGKEEEIDPDLPSAGSLTQDAIEKEYQRVSEAAFKDILKETDQAVPIPVTEEMTDTDVISIPGKGEASAAKLADKTEGVTLVDGRYQGTRIPGVYSNGERADFSVTVTNTGTADLYDVIVKDVISADLRKYLDESTLVYPKGELLSKGKDKIRVSETDGKEGSLILKLDHLKAGDQLLLHISGKLSGVRETVTGLANSVHISGRYITLNDDGKKNKVYIEDTELCHDTDLIGAGAPELVVCKLADRTRGAVLKDGRFSGRKSPGTYRPQDPLVFTIRVTNRGAVPAYHVTIDDALSARMADAVNARGFVFGRDDTINSMEGKKVHLEKAESGKLVIDCLEQGDSILVYYYCSIKKDARAAEDLVNEVTVGGRYSGGEEIEKTMLMQDSDQIDIVVDQEEETTENISETPPASPDRKQTEKPQIKQPKKTDSKGRTGTSSSVKTGDANASTEFILLAVLSLTVLLILSFMHRRSR